ncbi:MAG: helix-turn-helix domain-containing protein [Nitrospirota bacterium]
MTDNTGNNGQQSLPLKDRKEDILLLARKVIKSSEELTGTEPKELSKEVENYLLSYEWPGDEKELEVAVRRACILAEDRCLYIEDFDLRQRQAKSIGKFVESKLKGFMKNIKSFESFNLYDMVIPEVEKALIVMVMKETKDNQIKAARLLGINRNTLRSKIRKLGIKVKSIK